MKKVLFIGLGHMGLPMACNLLKNGFDVLGLDKDPHALAGFAARGGKTLKDPNALPTRIDVVITMLQHGEQVKSCCLGADGLYQKYPKGLLHIDCSTIDVENSRALAEQAQAHGHVMIDAPVSGGVVGAEQATLTFMVGGSALGFEQAHPMLSAMGKRIVHTGENGTGEAAKICNNMVLGISMIAISEAFVLAEKLGLEPQKLFEVMNSASGQCWALSQYAPIPHLVPHSPANRDFKPGFTTAMMLKDLVLSQQAADSAKLKTTLGQAATELYQKFAENEHTQHLDFSAIITALQGQTR